MERWGSVWGLYRGHPWAVASAVQLLGSTWGHTEAPAAERGIVALTLAFWIYVGTASLQGQGGQSPKWNLGVQVGLDVEVGLGRWPHFSTHLPGQLDRWLYAQD